MRGGRLMVGTFVAAVAYGSLAAAEPTGPGGSGGVGTPGTRGTPPSPGTTAGAPCVPDSVAAVPAANSDEIARVKAEIAARRVTVACLQAALGAAGAHLQSLTSSADLAVERYDIAVARATQADADADTRLAAYSAARAVRDAAQARLGRFAAEAYRRGPDLLWAATLLQARTPHDFALARYAFRSAVTSEARAVADARSAVAEADTARAAAVAAAEARHTAEQAAADARDQAQRAVALEQAQVAALQARQDALLADLAAAQGMEVGLERQRQEELAAAQASRYPVGLLVAGPVTAQPQARVLLAFVTAQLGKPYVWGAVGPDAFDCSGLAMRGLQAAGLNYPHPAQWQYLAMRPVAYSQLMPGDMVFWATDPADPHTIYHEAVYLGADRVIQAPHPGGVVDVASLWDNGVPGFYARP